MEAKKSQDIDIKHYLHVLLKRKWMILAVFAVAVLAAFYNSRRVIPFYRGTARIVIEEKNPNNLVSVREVWEMNPGSNTYMQTQFGIIKSRDLAAEVISRLNLENSDRFFPKPKDDAISIVQRTVNDLIQNGKRRILSLLNRGGGGGTSLASTGIEKKPGSMEPDAGPPAGLVSAFVGRVGVRQVPGTRLVDISFRSPDPNLSARVANELVSVYIERNMENKLKATQEAIEWLNRRVEEERRKVEEAENALLSYKDREGLLTDFSQGSGNIAAQELAQMKGQLLEAEAARVSAETRYKQALSLEEDPEMLSSIPEVLNSELIREIKKMEVVLYNRLSELSKKYGPNHPQMIAVNSELDELKRRRSNEIKRIINSLRNDYKLALAKEESLRRAFEEQKGRMLDLNKKAIQYRVLQRQANSSQQMYDLLFQRLKETSFSEEIEMGNIRIIDRAKTVNSPYNINIKGKMKKAMLVGLVLGVGLALLLEYLDNTLKFPNEVKDYLGIPYLGIVPAYDTKERMDGTTGDLITLHSPTSNPSESFRGIRTGILFSSADVDPQVILITSAGPSEGKTICASNLAVTMAQSGSATLLMDCDMRRPRVHSIFGIGKEAGLSSVIVGTSSLEDAVYSTGVDHLDVMPCGPIPPNPSEILGSNRMAELLKGFRKRYARIVIDSPPATAVTDASVLSGRVDGIVLVIRAGVTARKVVENSIEKLNMVNAHILGAVLNGVDTGKDSYYYQSYYYYYGTDDKKKKARRKRKKTGSYA